MTNKTTLFAMIERGGKLVAGPVSNVGMDTLEGIFEENVKPRTTISTDQL